MDSLASPDAITQSDLRIVSLPRLKLTFQALPVGESVRLYSIDHADLYITNERNEVSNIAQVVIVFGSNVERCFCCAALSRVSLPVDVV